MRPAAELAVRIGRELLKVSATSRSPRTWSPSMEQTLHSLGFRHSISPSLVSRVIDPFLLNHHSLALGFFNWAAQQPGYTHDSISYHSIFKTLSLSRQFSAMDALFKQVKTQRILLDPSVYRSLIDALLLGKKAQSAFWVLEEALSTGREVHHDVCNRLLAALTSDGCTDYAQKLFVKMRQRGVSLNTLGFGVYIGSFYKSSGTDQVLRLVGEVKKSNFEINGSIIALLILHGLCKCSREMDAFYILEELRNIDCKPDFMAYRIVAEAFVVTGNLYERQVVLKKKRKLGVAPRSSDYRDFILDLISAKRLIEAKEVAEVIVSGNFPIDNDVLDALIGSVSAVDPDSAVGFLNYMVINTGKMPSIRTLSKLSKNLCRHEKGDLLIKAYEVLSSRGYFSEPESYSLMISFLCKAGRVREGYSALHEMKKKGLDPDVSLYNALIEACCKAEMIRPAKKLWDEMFVEGCRMNLTTYNVLIKKLSEEGEVEESLRLFRKMLEKGIEPDETIYTSLIEGLCKDTKLEDALEVFRKCMESDQIVARRVLITLVLNLCSNGHFGEASQLLREREHLEHTSAHVVLLKCVADAKEVEIGIKHMKWIKEVSPSLVHTICSDLSASFCSSSDPDSILPFIRALELS